MIRCLALFALVAGLGAAMQTHDYTYQIDGTTFAGTATWSDAHDARRPLVLMVPNWMGPTPASLEKAQRIAGERYVVVMADVYGVDVRPQTTEEASAAASALRGDRPLLRRRGNRALAEARALGAVAPITPGRAAAIGFCFGGGTVLEMARSGTALDAVVSFHGNLDTPEPALAADIRASILVCHGAADPYVPQADVQAFIDEMQGGEVADWQVIQYGGAVHSFTDPQADTPGKADYDGRIAARAFAAMHQLFAERFAVER